MKKLLFTLMFTMLSMFTISTITASASTYGDLTYEISNGEVTITGCNGGTSGELVIPDTIDGYPVTTIGGYAFY